MTWHWSLDSRTISLLYSHELERWSEITKHSLRPLISLLVYSLACWYHWVHAVNKIYALHVENSCDKPHCDLIAHVHIPDIKKSWSSDINRPFLSCESIGTLVLCPDPFITHRKKVWWNIRVNYNSLLMIWQMSDQTKGCSDISKCWQDITL